MNPIAQELNQQLEKNVPAVHTLLSDLGKQMFFPKGILSQSAEAKKSAHKFNATIGIATSNGIPMHFSTADKYFQNLEAGEAYPYAPPAGKPKLRDLWKQKIINDNPSTNQKEFSTPIVTSALTHGLSIIADLFVNPGDVIVSPDKLWGNYRLTFSARRGGVFQTFPLFNETNQFNLDGFKEIIQKQAANNEKIIVLLNFPNNPTGYTPQEEDFNQIALILNEQAAQGTKILTICDDAYFGLFYENSAKESIFGKLCNLHENILSIKLDGITKEMFAWGFRTGFITYGIKTDQAAALYDALDKKIMGIIRGTISNCNTASQSIAEKMLADPDLQADRNEKYELLKGRATTLKSILEADKYQDFWEVYPFNSGYFMCIKLKTINAEKLRLHLLENYGVGLIAIGDTDIRVAFSCIEEESLQELFELIYQGCVDLS